MKLSHKAVMFGAGVALAGIVGVGVATATTPDQLPEDHSVLINQTGPNKGIDTTAVYTTEGRMVGRIPVGSLEEAERTGVEPTLPLGSGVYAVKGWKVYDESGDFIGYDLVNLGFLTTDQASDPAYVDRLMAEEERMTKDAVARFGPEFEQNFPK
jgi:hypothetical protein